MRNRADEVLVWVRPEKVGLTEHRDLVELHEEMGSSALETLPEWLRELARLEVLRRRHATLEKVWIGTSVRG